jgi:hypothetical protein
MTWESTGAIDVSTRTGNTKEPDDTWSPWSRESSEPKLVESPAARYFQVRARFAKDRAAELSAFEVAFVTDRNRSRSSRSPGRSTTPTKTTCATG